MTISALPPQILQYFNAALLATPAPLLRESSKSLWRVYSYILTRLRRSIAKDQKRLEKFILLELKFLEIYGRAKAKEKELEGKTEHQTQRSFYIIRGVNPKDERIFARLTRKAPYTTAISDHIGVNNAVS